MNFQYKIDQKISPEQFRDVLVRSGLSERRPVDDAGCIAKMVENADLFVTAWLDEELIGVARSVTDFAYCCYLSDIAVDKNHQHEGIGKQLIATTRQQLAKTCSLILLAAPSASGYYPKIGFRKHESAWIMPRENK